MCFSAAFFVHTLVWLICIGVAVALLRLLVPYILALFGVSGGVVMQAINIIVGAILLIAVIYLLFDIWTCLGPGYHPR